MNNTDFDKLIENDDVIPDPFKDVKTKNLNVSFNYEPTRLELQQGAALFKDLMKLSLNKKKKNYIGIQEHVIYNYLRGKPLFLGMNSIRTRQHPALFHYEMYYMDSWAYLPIKGEAVKYHQDLAKILGYKYFEVLKAISLAFNKQFNK